MPSLSPLSLSLTNSLAIVSCRDPSVDHFHCGHLLPGAAPHVGCYCAEERVYASGAKERLGAGAVSAMYKRVRVTTPPHFQALHTRMMKCTWVGGWNTRLPSKWGHDKHNFCFYFHQERLYRQLDLSLCQFMNSFSYSYSFSFRCVCAKFGNTL